MLTQSYALGASIKPLLGETLGVNFDLAAEKWGDNDALIVAKAAIDRLLNNPFPEFQALSKNS